MPIDLVIIHKIDPQQFKIINIRMIELRKQIEKFLEIVENLLSKRF